MTFEQGPIRPPSEAASFLLRITRNCPWNQCLFCSVYKNDKFSLRSVEEIKRDIQTARDITEDIKAISDKDRKSLFQPRTDLDPLIDVEYLADLDKIEALVAGLDKSKLLNKLGSGGISPWKTYAH